MFSLSFPLAALLFTSFASSLLFTKLITLGTHFRAVPFLALLFYLPTFFILDLIAICVVRFLLNPVRGWFSLAGFIFGTILSLFTLGGAASQIGFFYKTGGEIAWNEATSYATSKDGLKVLLSGSWAVLASAILLVAISFVLQTWAYRIFGLFNAALVANIFSPVSQFVLARCQKIRFLALRGTRYSRLSSNNEGAPGSESVSSDIPSNMDPDLEAHRLLNENEKTEEDGSRSRLAIIIVRMRNWWAIRIAVALFFIVALVTRPHKPYDHMSVTLPISMLNVFQPESDYCSEQRRIHANEWPLPDLLAKKNWEAPNDRWRGWSPAPNNHHVLDYRFWNPDWMPEQIPRGFERWDPNRFEKNGLPPPPPGHPSHKPGGPPHHPPHHPPPPHYPPPPHHPPPPPGGPSPPGHHPPPPPLPHKLFGHFPRDDEEEGNHKKGEKKANCPSLPKFSPFYNPVEDPLKITNLDNDILAPLKDAMSDGSVKIKHVVYILMESVREELFPLKQDSFMHKTILDASEEDEKDLVNSRLADMTPHIEQITGVAGNFKAANGTSLPHSDLVWKDTAKEGFGGINIIGASTTSTMSTKSFGTNFCGAWSMPVEKFAEYATDSYQPCLPQIFDMFNGFKHSDQADDYREMKWHPKLFMSVTETYDNMAKFDRKIGFTDVVCEAELKEDVQRNVTDADGQKIGYFGFAEPILKPYITDYITDSIKNNKRMMMAHFTSTTHHPWELPDTFNMTDYLPTSGLKNWHNDFNKYLNTMRYHDLWMAELMSTFDKLGITNETLIVFAGDHGQAFKEDARKTGTYENGHISNYRVPITFRHPHLPRYQHKVNATTVSTLPTILDLLINTGSLNEKDKAIASDLIQDYEGQSLIRPYKTNHKGRRAWNFGITNSGAGMLAVTSADSPWRLVMPLDKTFEYSLSNLEKDVQEEHAITAWTFDDLLSKGEKEFGADAVAWAKEAEAVAKWWRKDRQRLWRYHEIENT